MNDSNQPATIRLLADDLTGALDTAAEFASAAAPLHAFWHGGLPTHLPPSAAIDTGTRERTTDEARAIIRQFVPALAGAQIAYKKVDSLMRGPTLAELTETFATGYWPACIFAPAFPYQGRITRAGRQYARTGDTWTPAGPDLVAALRQLGAPANRAGGPLQPGITVFDAETDADLDAIAAQPLPGPVLWCGTAGLARALAHHASPGSHPAAQATLPRPILGLFGSDHPATAAQLAACAPHWSRLPDAGAASHADLAHRLADTELALVSLDLPPGLPRDAAAARIAADLHGLCAARPTPPGTLLCSGGETLRGLCLALGATSLELQGRIRPGLPRSILRGGPWDGVTIVSKSGAFGPPGLLQHLLALNGFPPERTP